MHVPYGHNPYSQHPQQPQQPQYQQQPQPQQHQGWPQPQQQQQQPLQAPWGSVQLPQVSLRNMQMPFGVGGIGGMSTPSGLPAPLAFGLGIVAVLVALVFDVVFLKVTIPGVGGYAWYLTTALSFMGAGYGSMMWTRAGKSLSFVAVGMAAVLYGIADLGLGLVLEHLSFSSSIILGAQGVAIGFFCGFGGVYKAIRAKNNSDD